MVKPNATFIDSIVSAPLLQRCGVDDSIDIPFDACAIKSWADVASTLTEDWLSLQHDRRNDLTSTLSLAYRDLYREWNGLFSQIETMLQPVFNSNLENYFTMAGLGLPYFRTMIIDLKMATMEASYALAGCTIPNFFRTLAKVYLAGHFPCGWEGGEFPEGFLVYL
jgi:hypothetical protein